MKAKMEQFPATNPHPVLCVEKDGTVIYSNKAGEPLLNEWGVGVGDKLSSCIGNFVVEILSRNSPGKIEVKVGERVYLVDFHPVPEEGCVNIYGFDISDQKELEEKLRESMEKYRNIAEVSNEGIWIIDTEDRTIYVNSRMAEMLGYSPEEMFGKSGWDFASEDGKAILKMDVKKRLRYIIEKPEFKLIRKNGSTLWVLINVKLFLNKEGKLAGYIGTFTDITRQKETEAKLKETYDNLEKLVEARTVQLEKANKSLKESQKSLAEAQRIAHIGSWEWDVAANKAQWSEEMYRIFRLNPQEIAPDLNKFLNYIHPDDRGCIDKIIKKRSEGFLDGIDYRVILANGEERTVYTQTEVIFNEKNIPIRVKGIVQDITERKKSEEKIESLANIVESSNDAIITKSFDGIITSWNKGAEQVYGYSAEEIHGKNVSIIEPDYLKGEIEQLGEKIKQGEKVQNYETSRLRKDGTIINVSLTLSPVFDSSGKLVAISAIARDTTESKRAEEKLRESEEKYRNIVEIANEGILVIDAELRITYYNKKLMEMLGYNSKEGIGRPIWDFIREESKVSVKLNMEKRRQGINESYELELICKDGSSLWVLLNSKSLFDKDGKFIGSISMLTDITKRKVAEDALANIETARKKEIHHRIKNNLQVISSLLDLQAEQFKGRKAIKDSEVLEAFRESQDRVISMALIHEELYRGGGFETLDFSPYIGELAENLFQTYRLGNTDISLTIDLEENLLFDMDTAVPLGMIVNELVSNSLKHAFSGNSKGEIRIKLRRDENGNCLIIKKENKNEEFMSNTFVLTISDNGAGIPEDIDIRVIDSLGLQLVNSLVDQLGGELELKRNNGTEFTIKFTVTEINQQAELKNMAK